MIQPEEAAERTIAYLLKRFGMKGHSEEMPVEVPNFGRNDLAKVFYELGHTRGVELGVMQGLYSEVLCSVNPDLKLHCVDLWSARREYVDIRVPQEHFTQWEAEARERLANRNVVILKKDTVEAAKDFEDRSLDFVYVDADHSFMTCLQDIAAWTPKVKVGGIMAGHDFAKIRLPGRRRFQGAPGSRVVPAVLAWTMAYEISPWFVLGRKAMLPGEVRDQARTWLWVVR